MANNIYEFPCSRWLSESEDDGQISRDLILAGDNENFTPGKSVSDFDCYSFFFEFLKNLRVWLSIWPKQVNLGSLRGIAARIHFKSHVNSLLHSLSLHTGLLYNLHITTSDIRGAGTSAKVYVILYSEDGNQSSGKLWIRNGKGNNFERGRTDLFIVECAEQLSPVHHITVGHDNSGMGAGWNLEKVSGIRY